MTRAICVFCGSARGARARYAEVAAEFGREVARRKVAIVYGGAHRGLMGVMADAALAAHGRVIGVIPDTLMEPEIAHTGLTELHVVPSMHARKALMADLSDAVVMLPGGLGTLDEMFEMWTWAMLGLHARPMGILNVDGYYDPLLRMVERMSSEGFVAERELARVQVRGTVGEVLSALTST